ncbi:hypothetical protein F4X86_01795 [Candidatus Saccharibacteria bacterium]|nr:hypothetical protein [Candidatus Saccharibacteria bacterium]
MENQAPRPEVGMDPETPILNEFLEHGIDNEQDCFKVLLAVLNGIARYIDYIHHCEPANAAIIRDAGHQLLNVASLLAQFKGLHLPTAYAERLAQIEEANGVKYNRFRRGLLQPTGADIVAVANSWQAMQEGQSLHDEQFHPAVINNPEIWKLGHYANHISKLPLYFLEGMDGERSETDSSKDLADLTAFGIKLITEFIGQRLPDTPVHSS